MKMESTSHGGQGEMSTVKGLLLGLAVISTLYCSTNSQAITATCTIMSGSGVGTVSGTIRLSQATSASNVTMVINLSGLNVSSTQHGFHAHANRSIANLCNSAATHLNLQNTAHGAPYNPATTRHTGDFGNVNVTDSNGNIVTTISDRLVTLQGPNSIIGFPIVIHADMDDLGLGGFNDSTTSGHAGARLGCCLIMADASASARLSPPLALLTYALLLALLEGARSLAG